MLAQSGAVPDFDLWEQHRGRLRLGRLRAELATVRRENRALWSRLSPPGRIPSGLGVSRNEGRLLAALLVNRALSREALLYSICRDIPEAETPDIRLVDSVVCSLRKRLLPHGVTITTPRCGAGYLMLEIDRAKVAVMIAAEAKATQRPIGEFVAVELTAFPFCVPTHGRRTKR